MEFNALVWAKAQDGEWHRGTVISREETGDLRHIKVGSSRGYRHEHRRQLLGKFVFAP